MSDIMEGLFHDLAWDRRPISRDHSTWIHEGTDTEMSPISDDDTELVSTAIRELIFYHDADMRVIVSEIGDLGSATDIDAIADHRVSDIGEMRYC
jgi:hypothetical protein